MHRSTGDMPQPACREMTNKVGDIKRQRPLRLAAVSALVLVVLALAPASASAEALCSDTWTGPAEGSWATAANWSAGHAPTSTDVACIGAGKTVKVTEGTNQAGVVQGEGTVAISSGSLEVANALEASNLHSLTISGGTLSGAGTLNLSANFSWTGGTMSGTGSTVLGSSVTAALATESNYFLGGARTLHNEGALTLSKGQLWMSGTAKLQNSAMLKLNAVGGIINQSGEPLIVNSGTIERIEGTGVAGTAVSVENLGTIKGNSSGLSFEGAGSTLTLASGSTLEGTILFHGPAVTGGSFHAASANVTLSTNTFSVTTGATATIGELAFTGGTVSGAGTLDISKSASWSAGTMSGTGATVFGTGVATLFSAGSSFFIAGGRSVVNEGTVTFTLGQLWMSESARLTNAGTFKMNSESGIRSGSGEPLIINTGTFEKTEGTWTTGVVPKFESSGSLLVAAGHLEFSNPVFLEPSTQYGEENPSASGHPHPTCGKPVSCATGNESTTQTDLTVAGRGVGLDLTRTYNAQAAASGSRSAFGYGWTSSFSDHLVVDKASKLATLYQANGSSVPFKEGSGGAFTPPTWTQDALSGTAEAGYTLTRATQDQYKFAGGTGRLESITDRNGNATTLSYTEAGRLEAITDPAGRKLTLAYNAEGLLESAKDPMGHVAKYTYEAGSLATVTEPGEVTARWQFKYDATHRLTTITDGRGGKTTNEYDSSNRVISQTDPLERKLSFEYEAFHTRITNKATGSVTDEYFTSQDEPSSITRGFGTASATTDSYTYDTAGNVTSVTDGNGHTTKYSYDTASNRTSTLDADKDETKWGYNSTHDVTATTTPKGETTTIKRDTHGNAEVIERPAPSGETQSTSYSYDVHGNLERIEDALKRIWKYEYDGAGDLTAETDPEGDKRTWTYDSDSRESSTVSPSGHTTKIERDSQGRPLKLQNPLSKTTFYTYDANGNVATLRDAKSNTTTYTYDADNEVTKATAAGTVAETGYDGAGRVTTQTDGNKHTTSYARNILGEISESTDPLGRKITREYDKAGNLESVTDPAKRKASYTDDAANRLIELAYSDGTTPTVKYEYDTNGNRTRIADGTGTTSYNYDQLDRLIEAVDGHGNVSKYEYDRAEEQTRITYPNSKSVSRTYDGAGRVKSVTDWLENTTKFAYSADSVQTTTTFPPSTGDADTYTLNAADQVTAIGMGKGAETLASLNYGRDANGQVSAVNATGLLAAPENKYVLDGRSHLTKSGATEYQYDGANNATKAGSTTNSYDAADELEKGTGVTYSYNELGERVKRTPATGPAISYGYDQAGDLTSVTRPKVGETGAIEDTYAYSGNGLRASQTVSGATTFMAWDATAAVPALLSDGTNSYLYGPGGLPVEQISGAGAVLYLHHDQQGSTRMLTGSAGTAEATISYDPYGNTTGHTGTAATPLGYDGQYTSSDSGLVYLRSRSYDPATAQFLSVDPIAPVSRARYSYSEDNPVNYADPTGLCSINPFSSSNCVSEGVHAAVHFAEEHPVATGIALGVVAVGTGGAALAVEGGVATSVLGGAATAAGLGAGALDTSKCLHGDAGACVGAGLGLGSLGLTGPEFLASRRLIEDAQIYRGLAGAGVMLGAYATLSDLLAGDPNFLSPLFGC
jgi:RHS repeat-associated protein